MTGGHRENSQTNTESSEYDPRTRDLIGRDLSHPSVSSDQSASSDAADRSRGSAATSEMLPAQTTTPRTNPNSESRADTLRLGRGHASQWDASRAKRFASRAVHCETVVWALASLDLHVQAYHFRKRVTNNRHMSCLGVSNQLMEHLRVPEGCVQISFTGWFIHLIHKDPMGTDFFFFYFGLWIVFSMFAGPISPSAAAKETVGSLVAWTMLFVIVIHFFHIFRDIVKRVRVRDWG